MAGNNETAVVVGGEPGNVPVLVIETATFYFPPGTSYDEAGAEIAGRLSGLDFTMVTREVTR